ncbi:MAG: hypothetical protein WBL53_12340 [Pseudonocardiaceae bacterium]
MIEVGELTARAGHDVFVRSPRRSGLARILTGLVATVLADRGRGLWVTGMDTCVIASVAAARCKPIQQLTPRNASPEDA